MKAQAHLLLFVSFILWHYQTLFVCLKSLDQDQSLRHSLKDNFY